MRKQAVQAFDRCRGRGSVESIRLIQADVCLMGVTGVHAEIGLTTGYAEEAAIKRALSRQAAETVALASNEKLGAVSPFAVLPMTEVDTLVVEATAPAPMLETLRSVGVTVITA